MTTITTVRTAPRHILLPPETHHAVPAVTSTYLYLRPIKQRQSPHNLHLAREDLCVVVEGSVFGCFIEGVEAVDGRCEPCRGATVDRV